MRPNYGLHALVGSQKQRVTDVISFITEVKSKTRMGEGVREPIRRQISAGKKKTLLKTRDIERGDEEVAG